MSGSTEFERRMADHYEAELRRKRAQVELSEFEAAEKEKRRQRERAELHKALFWLFMIFFAAGAIGLLRLVLGP